MKNLLVFYGDVIRDGPSGVDVSMCQSTTVVVRDMVEVGYAAVRRCIRAAFGPEMRGRKMTMEAFVVAGGNDGTVPRWGLRPVTGENS
jgi:hypothetical protein